MSRRLFGECESGNLEEAKLMVLDGANVNMTNNDNFGETPLYEASRDGHLEIVKVLIDVCALLDTANNNGWTPLYIASENGHLEIVIVIINQLIC